MLGRKLADRWLRPEIARFVAIVILAMAVCLAILMFATNDRGQTAFGTSLGSDYAEFYVAGQILNDGQASRLYDLEFQDQRLHQLLPKLSKDEHLPFVYPPFLAVIFQPLARLPFAGSFAIWLAITLGSYVTGVELCLRSSESIPIDQRTTARLLALAFPPFAMECCLGGQISAIGCLSVSSALVFGKMSRRFGSGLVLSILFYKPTLLILILPMLLIGRAWRTLAGLMVGGVVLGFVSWLIVGRLGCLDFLGLMAGYGRSGGSAGQGFKLIKYVDLTAFVGLLGVGTHWRRPMALAIGAPFLIALGIAWARTCQGRIHARTWAATLCFTPILNLYGPIYDVSVVVPGLILGVNVIREESGGGCPPRFRGLLASLILAALLTQPLAQKLGFQPLTLALLALGSFFLANQATIWSKAGGDSTSQQARQAL